MLDSDSSLIFELSDEEVPAYLEQSWIERHVVTSSMRRNLRRAMDARERNVERNNRREASSSRIGRWYRRARDRRGTLNRVGVIGALRNDSLMPDDVIRTVLEFMGPRYERSGRIRPRFRRVAYFHDDH